MNHPKPLDCKPGDTVAYTARFLKSCGLVTGPAGATRGVVCAVESGDLDPSRFARVLWAGDAASVLVHKGNLAKPGPNARFADAG